MQKNCKTSAGVFLMMGNFFSASARVFDAMESMAAARRKIFRDENQWKINSKETSFRVFCLLHK